MHQRGTMITTVIFDLDGLLADTERLHCHAYQLALREHDIELTAADYGEHWVRHGKGIHDWVALHRFAVDPAALRARKAEHYQELLRSSLQPMAGAVGLLDRLAGVMPMALASSSYRDAVDGVITGLGIAGYFATIVSGLDVERVKPAPDIFLEAARRLGAAPNQCAVIEDAEKGIRAAHAAGMCSIAVPYDLTRHHDFSQATRVCASLNEVTVELLRRLGEE